MKIKHIFSLTILSCFISSMMYSVPASATKWVHPFVVWNDYVYVITEEYVTDVETEIGQVTSYSDMERKVGNFSNVYKEGTKYYSINGISTDEAIAVQLEGNLYQKAVREGIYKFGVNAKESIKKEPSNLTSFIALLGTVFVLMLVFTFIVEKRVKR
ncbi:hypothetical protein ACFSCX_24250 [Bacillus salitolerans]|uniref:Uncharacterized protein n=1 Tax=Bacillus salitolerans TaxID=1437434 RepID=A0ABW4LXW2_9BACI